MLWVAEERHGESSALLNKKKIRKVVTPIQHLGNSQNVEKVKIYKSKIEEELRDKCQGILNLLTQHLIPCAADPEAKVFYYKMEGDYHRYIAEFSAGDAKQAASGKALEAYQNAHNSCGGDKISSTHPIRLGLALNFSVFYYEILQKPEEACKMAKQAFDDAIADLDNVGDEYYKDSTLIMQLLRDNLTLWTSDMPEEDK
jgi:14-3-3 protein epsilon